MKKWFSAGEEYKSREEAEAAIEAREITFREYTERYGYQVDFDGAHFLDNGAILSENRDWNGEAYYCQNGKEYWPVYEADVDEEGNTEQAEIIGYKVF